VTDRIRRAWASAVASMRGPGRAIDRGVGALDPVLPPGRSIVASMTARSVAASANSARARFSDLDRGRAGMSMPPRWAAGSAIAGDLPGRAVGPVLEPACVLLGPTARIAPAAPGVHSPFVVL
jgi:hypothetical protein